MHPEARARQLDAVADCNLRASPALPATHLEAARCLAEIHDERAYRYLGFTTWEGYLGSKSGRYGRTSLSFLVKLGRAGDLSARLPRGMSLSALVEYAKATDFPEKIAVLIACTWDRARNLSVRELRVLLDDFVTRNPGFRGPEIRRRSRKAPGRIDQILDEMGRWSDEERREFLPRFVGRFKISFSGMSSDV